MNDLSRPNYRSFLLPVLVCSAFFGLLLGCIAPALIPIFVLTYLLVGLAWFLCMKYLVIGSTYRSIGSKGVLCGSFQSAIALAILAILYLPEIKYIDAYHPFALMLNVAGFIGMFVMLPAGIIAFSLIYGAVVGLYFAGKFDRESERYHLMRNPEPIFQSNHPPQAKAEAVVWAIRCEDDACRHWGDPVQ